MIFQHDDIDLKKVSELAIEYQINEVYLFGSSLRDDFNIDSDIDILIAFKDDVHYSYFDLCDLQEKFEALFHRKIDLVEKEGLINPYRRSEILRTARLIYAA